MPNAEKDGTAVWPNDSEGHDVKFHVGTGTVVCTCGAYFESERFSVTLPRSAVSLWAEHVRRTRPIPPGACPCGHPADDHDDEGACMHLCDCAWPLPPEETNPND